jgi:two-component sensor histidine kinase
MYKLEYESQDNEVYQIIEFENFNDLFTETSNKKPVYKYPLSEIFDLVDYGINILKPVEDNDNVFIYTNPLLWDYIKPGFHEYLLGRRFNEVFPKNEKFNLLSMHETKNNAPIKTFLKLYNDNGKLIKVWSTLKVLHHDLLYLCIKDHTDFYIEKEKEDTIFKYSAFPLLEVNRENVIVRVNNAYEDFIGYDVSGINSLGLGSTITGFKSSHPEIHNFLDCFNYIFNKKVKYDDAQLELINKKGELKQVNAHFRLISNNLIQITLHDLTELKETQNDALNLNQYLTDIEEVSNTCLTIHDSEGYHWTNQIHNILDLSEDSEYTGFTKENILFKYVKNEDLDRLENEIKKLSLNNPVSVEYDINTNKGNYKHLKTYMKIKIQNDKIITLCFTQDITEEYLAKKSAITLKENIEYLQGYCKIVIAEFYDNKNHFTSEIYNILETSPEEYSQDELDELMYPEDLKLFNENLNNLSLFNPTFKQVYHLITPKGNLRVLSANAVGKFNKQGQLVKTVCFIQDITEQALAQKEAANLHDNFSVIQESSKIVLCEYDKGEYSFTSEIYNILGIRKEDYSSKVNIVQEFILPEDYEILDDALKLNVKNPISKVNFRIKNIDGEVRYLDSINKATKFTPDGETTHIIGFVQDVTNEKLAQLESDNLEKSLSRISEFSKIVIATYEDDKYTWTPEIYNILKINPNDYSCEESILKDFEDPVEYEHFYNTIFNLTPENNTYSTIRNLVDSEGDKKYLNCKIVADFDDNGENRILYGFLQDITDEVNARESTIQLERDLNIIQSSSKIILAHYKDNEHFFTSEIYNILEIDPIICPTGEDIVHSYLKNGLSSDFVDKILKINYLNPNLHDVVKITTPKGNVKVLECFIEAEFDENHDLSEIVGLIQEITDKVEREEELSRLSEDRKILLQEVHHRVKNNLQLILSFLNLESRYHSADPEYVIEQTRNRIRTMALTHEEVYQSPSVSKVNLESFINTGISNLFHLYTEGSIVPHLSIEPIELDVDKSIPLGLLINELSLNSMKYAFPDTGEGDFYISLKKLEDNIVMRVWDNGIGLPDDFSFEDSTGLGFIIVQSLIRQLEGDFVLLDDCAGFGIELTFPL